MAAIFKTGRPEEEVLQGHSELGDTVVVQLDQVRKCLSRGYGRDISNGTRWIFDSKISTIPAPWTTVPVSHLSLWKYRVRDVRTRETIRVRCLPRMEGSREGAMRGKDKADGVTRWRTSDVPGTGVEKLDPIVYCRV